MVAKAFLQCKLDADGHAGIKHALGLPEGRSHTLPGRPGSPIHRYWVADLAYDAFGHLFFFGVEIDLRRLAADGDASAADWEELELAFGQALRAELNDAAGVLPALRQWDCNTLQYVVAAESSAALLAASASAIMVGEETPILSEGKHASGSVGLSVQTGEGKACIVATCRRGKLNSLLGIRGLADRPLEQLLALDARKVVEPVWKRATHTALPL